MAEPQSQKLISQFRKNYYFLFSKIIFWPYFLGYQQLWSVYFFTLLGIPRTNSIGRVSDAGANVADSLPNSEEAIRRGEYVIIRSLIRVLEVIFFFVLPLVGLFLPLNSARVNFSSIDAMSSGWC